jgi:hypothetical protein
MRLLSILKLYPSCHPKIVSRSLSTVWRLSTEWNCCHRDHRDVRSKPGEVECARSSGNLGGGRRG